MPKLKIDGLEIEVEQGTKVIEAAARLGIVIPRFCYHAGLGSVGACRMCAVKFLEGPVKGVQMSCMTDAADGMVVSTTDAEAVDFRRHIIEWLMMNHPHDCPVCDEGGHCLLQDMTVSGGHGIRRYLGEKRTHQDQDLGPLVQHEMNRCIHCWRCRRFYQDFAGYRDLGAVQIAYRTYFGRYANGTLESPFAGNLIDLCPTGVYTDKPSRFRGRRWDYLRGPSLCIHCSLGCHVIASVRYREVVRLEAHFDESVNGYFICDRGRYGFSYASHVERPRRAKIGSEEVLWSEVIRFAGERLREVSQKTGPRSIACLGSTRSSLENQGMLKRLCQVTGWRGPGFFVNPSMERKVKKAVSRLDSRLAVSLREIEKADFILVAGADPVNEAPMLALAIRQAHRRGATVVVIDPRPILLPLPFDHFPVAPREIDGCLTLMVKGAVNRTSAEELGPSAIRFYDAVPQENPFSSPLSERFDLTVQKLRQSHHIVIACGTDIVQESTPDVAADNALLLQQDQKKAGLFYLMPGANAFGAALLSDENSSLTAVVEAIERGEIKALVLMENDPFWSFPDQQRLGRAIGKLDLLLVMDYLSPRTASHAHVFLPTLPLFETHASFVNQEGRVQSVKRVHAGGISLEQVGGGEHPPRVFRDEIPGSEPKPAWEIVTALSRAMAIQEIVVDDLWPRLAEGNPAFHALKNFALQQESVRLVPAESTAVSFSLDRLNQKQDKSSEGKLDLFAVDWTFGTEELSSYSRSLHEVEKTPCIYMNAMDAERLSLTNKDQVALSVGGAVMEVELSVTEHMASGILILPRHRQIPWQRLPNLPISIAFERIKKIQAKLDLRSSEG
jgi:NADH-quinone oxidoreductase subunit G